MNIRDRILMEINELKKEKDALTPDELKNMMLRAGVIQKWKRKEYCEWLLATGSIRFGQNGEVILK